MGQQRRGARQMWTRQTRLTISSSRFSSFSFFWSSKSRSCLLWNCKMGPHWRTSAVKRQGISLFKASVGQTTHRLSQVQFVQFQHCLKNTMATVGH